MGLPNGDIKLSSNFELNAGVPIDARFIVNTYADLTTISFKYKGMIVWVVADELHYKLSNDLTTWTEIGGGSSYTAGNGIVIDGDEIKIDDSNLNIDSNYTTFTTINDFEINANRFIVNSTSWVYLNANAPVQIVTPAPINLTGGASNININSGLIELKSISGAINLETNSSMRLNSNNLDVNVVNGSVTIDATYPIILTSEQAPIILNATTAPITLNSMYLNIDTTNDITVDAGGQMIINSNYSIFNTVNDFYVQTNKFTVNSNSWVYMNATAPMELFSSAYLKMYSDGPLFLTTTGATIQIDSGASPVELITSNALTYVYDTPRVNDDSSGTTDLVIPHKKWVKNWVATHSSTSGGASYTGTNGITIVDGAIELGGQLNKTTTIDADNNVFRILNTSDLSIGNAFTISSEATIISDPYSTNYQIALDAYSGFIKMKASTTSTNFVNIKTDLLTDERYINFPDKDGTVAYLSDVPVAGAFTSATLDTSGTYIDPSYNAYLLDCTHKPMTHFSISESVDFCIGFTNLDVGSRLTVYCTNTGTDLKLGTPSTDIGGGILPPSGSYDGTCYTIDQSNTTLALYTAPTLTGAGLYIFDILCIATNTYTCKINKYL